MTVLKPGCAVALALEFFARFPASYGQSVEPSVESVASEVAAEDVTLDNAAPAPPPPPLEAPLPPPPPAATEPAAIPLPDPVASDPAVAPQKGEGYEGSAPDTSKAQDEFADEDEVGRVQAPTEIGVQEPATDKGKEVSGARESDVEQGNLYGKRMFGESRIQLGLNQPDFTDHKAIREKLYGKPPVHPSFTVDWFPLDWWINPGLTGRIAGYSVTGKAVKGSPTQSQVDSGEVTVDENSETRLLFIPLMAGVKVEMTPFRSKALVFDGWIGYEYGWWQETRDVSSAVRPEVRFSKVGSGGQSDSTETDPVFTNKGAKTAIVYGASINILLNWLDERSVRSMVDTLSISHVYLSPFFEAVQSQDTSGLTFSRNTIGVGFTFETL